MTAPADVAGALKLRYAGIDKLRGLAIALMFVDHALLITGADGLLRWGPTRAAMPLFMLIGGSLVSRLTWRHAWVAVLGLGLTYLVPWAGEPNILLCYALGALAVVGLRRLGGYGPLWGVVVCFGLLSNHVNVGGYSLAAVVGLVLLGSMTPAAYLGWVGDHLPRFLEVLGRWPLTLYVGHLLWLQSWVVLYRMIEGT